MSGTVFRLLRLSAALLLCSCSLVSYQPLETIDKIDPDSGYRLGSRFGQSEDDTLLVLAFSGGGSRAAAFGYGVLEQLNRQQVEIGGRRQSLLESTDLVYGVSGGSVLAAYYSLHGKDSIPAFEKRFLKQNFQRQVAGQVFSLANMPRLTSPQFGRSDLVQEQFEAALFGQTTFGDLEKRRKGPFAVISATDMSLGSRFDFVQEYFDPMCLNLAKLPIARAVAASSAVPLVFSPITLNNNGGRCGYRPPAHLQAPSKSQDGEGRLQDETRKEYLRQIEAYTDGGKRPFIHLLDGGLTDNLALRGLLDGTVVHPQALLQRSLAENRLKRVVLISVNAQNQAGSPIDQSADVPGFKPVLDAVVNVPIDRNSQESLRQVRAYADQWNAKLPAGGAAPRVYFVSLQLRDLPPSVLKEQVLNISTSFRLLPSEVNALKQAAAVLLRTSPEYRRLLDDLSATPDNSPMPADLQAAAAVSAALGHDGADGNAAASAASAPAAE